MLPGHDPSRRRDHNSMYQLEYPAPLESDDAAAGIPMLVALQGYADAGQAVAHAGTHILEALDSDVLASFHLDELIDYRARRPSVTIEGNHLHKGENLSLDLHAVRDANGKPFLLLSGPEPDLKWEAFSHAVVELAEQANVNKIISLYAAPMPMPHTRPILVSAHASDPSLVAKYHAWEARMLVPGAAALELEMSLGREGFDTIGLTAHVPHYVAQSDYPEATHSLLQAFSNLADREIPLGAIESDMNRVKDQLARQMDESNEIAAVVGALQRRYDQYFEDTDDQRRNELINPGESIPTGEELGAEFEAFLEQMSRESDDEIGKSGDGDSDTDDHPSTDDLE